MFIVCAAALSPMLSSDSAAEDLSVERLVPYMSHSFIPDLLERHRLAHNVTARRAFLGNDNILAGGIHSLVP